MRLWNDLERVSQKLCAPLCVSLWNDLSDPVFDGVGPAGLFCLLLFYLLLPSMGWLYGVGVFGLIECSHSLPATYTHTSMCSVYMMCNAHYTRRCVQYRVCNTHYTPRYVESWVYITHTRFDAGVCIICTMHTLNSIKHTQISAKIYICIVFTQAGVWKKHKDFASTISPKHTTKLSVLIQVILSVRVRHLLLLKHLFFNVITSPKYPSHVSMTFKLLCLRGHFVFISFQFLHKLCYASINRPGSSDTPHIVLAFLK